MRTRSGRIVEFALPFVRQGATALALAALVAGCDCTSRFLVPLSEEEGEALRAAHEGADLPAATCNALCIPPDPQLADGGPPETAEEAGFSVILCHVVQNGSEPALYCAGQYPDACIGGRRPARLAERDRGRAGGGAVAAEGATFAALARMESASVLAFVELAVELCAHGAPDALVRRALSAAVDEVRHAQVAAALARGRGAEPEGAVVAIAAVRSLDVLLRDNATEGLVLEGWGAIAAAADARSARDPVVRRALGAIAADEAGHAALARSVDAWLCGRASQAARGRAREARAEALAGLATAIENGTSTGLGGRDVEREVDRVRRFARQRLPTT